MKALIELQYLPSVAYFAALQSGAEIIIEKHEYFVKQTYRNRCHITTSQGEEQLIIPVTNKHGKVVVTDVKIDYAQKWLNNHWRTIQSAYGKSAFYEHYAPSLEKVLFKKHTFLYDLNFELLSLCLTWLKWNIPVSESLSYIKDAGPDVVDLRSRLNAKKNDLLPDFYNPVPYTQVFGNPFASNLSLIDLIFCEGPAAARLVKASSVEK